MDMLAKPNGEEKIPKVDLRKQKVKPAAILYQISISDDSTLINDIYLTKLGPGWLVVDQSMKVTIFLPDRIRFDHPTTLVQIRATLRNCNLILACDWDAYDASRVSFFYYLATCGKHPDSLPRVINVTSIRESLISN